MTVRVAKLARVVVMAIFYSLVVFNNTIDYDSNHQFVRHVLMMDSTFPGNRHMWRAWNSQCGTQSLIFRSSAGKP
jgi:predicted small integral membrane protein